MTYDLFHYFSAGYMHMPPRRGLAARFALGAYMP